MDSLLGPLAGMQPRQIALQILNFALVLSTAFMLWKGLSVVTDSQSPIVVVLSGSMEPAFNRGDLLFLWNRAKETKIGEVVVYSVKGKDIPIVHRVVRRFGGGPNPLYLLTKGDNNVADDTELYARGQSFLNRERDVIGSVFGYIPFVGYVTILLKGVAVLRHHALTIGRPFHDFYTLVEEDEWLSAYFSISERSELEALLILAILAGALFVQAKFLCALSRLYGGRQMRVSWWIFALTTIFSVIWSSLQITSSQGRSDIMA